MKRMSEKAHITGLSPHELADMVEQMGEPRYRAKQLFRQLHGRRLLGISEMTDLPKAFRAKLEEAAKAKSLTVESRYISEDGTRRFLMKTHDGRPVEAVFIPTEGRDTICFSSQ